MRGWKEGVLYVTELEFDEHNTAEMARHGVRPEEVWQVLTMAPRFFTNRAGRSASHVMIGPTYGGRLLTVPIGPTAVEGRWRPATAWPSAAKEQARYTR